MKEINPDFWKCQNCKHFIQGCPADIVGRCNLVSVMNQHTYSPEDVAVYVENAKTIESRIVSPENETWFGVNFGCIHFDSKEKSTRRIEKSDLENMELDPLPIRRGCFGECACIGTCLDVVGYISRVDYEQGKLHLL